PKITVALQRSPVLADVNSDQQDKGLETDLTIDRPTAARLGIKASQIDNTLYDAFGQRLVSTIFNPLNQYHVVMEVAPRYWQSPDILKDVYVSTSGNINDTASTNAVAGTVAGSGTTASAVGPSAEQNAATNAITATGNASASTGEADSTASETMVPLAAVSSFGPGTTPLAVAHQGLSVATTISFNLARGKTLSDASDAITAAMNQLGVPAHI